MNCMYCSALLLAIFGILRCNAQATCNVGATATGTLVANSGVSAVTSTQCSGSTMNRCATVTYTITTGTGSAAVTAGQLISYVCTTDTACTTSGSNAVCTANALNTALTALGATCTETCCDGTSSGTANCNTVATTGGAAPVAHSVCLVLLLNGLIALLLH